MLTRLVPTRMVYLVLLGLLVLPCGDGGNHLVEQRGDDIEVGIAPGLEPFG